jgi:hypothetical protein
MNVAPPIPEMSISGDLVSCRQSKGGLSYGADYIDNPGFGVAGSDTFLAAQ